MGRHSAPDDSDDEVAAAGIALVPDDDLAEIIAARGRHARHDEVAPDTDVEHTQRIPAVPDAPCDSEPTLEVRAQPDRQARESNTKADLRVLRQHPAVRAQAIAAVLVSFLLYTLVIIVLGRTASYLLWLWIPIVASGILVGLVLDLAHRRLTKQTDQPGR